MGWRSSYKSIGEENRTAKRIRTVKTQNRRRDKHRSRGERKTASQLTPSIPPFFALAHRRFIIRERRFFAAALVLPSFWRDDGAQSFGGANSMGTAPLSAGATKRSWKDREYGERQSQTRKAQGFGSWVDQNCDGSIVDDVMGMQAVSWAVVSSSEVQRAQQGGR